MVLLLCLLTIIGLDEFSFETMQSEVVLTSLSNPVYPRLARQAHVAGDVELKLSVRADGTIESADVISGPAMLRDAALVSARQSKFACHDCSENVGSYRLMYSFQLVPGVYGPDCQVKSDTTYPQVLQSQNRVTVVAQSFVTCDPYETIKKVRSAKCLFLWKCGK
jgi:hypothetical protein